MCIQRLLTSREFEHFSVVARGRIQLLLASNSSLSVQTCCNFAENQSIGMMKGINFIGDVRHSVRDVGSAVLTAKLDLGGRHEMKLNISA